MQTTAAIVPAVSTLGLSLPVNMLALAGGKKRTHEERKAGITATPGTAATATAGEEDCDHPKSKEGIKKGKEKRQRPAQEGEDEGEDDNDQTEQNIPERRC